MAASSTHPHPGVARMLIAKLVDGKTQRDRVLDALEDGEATRAELAAELGISPKSAENVVSKLINEGLIEAAARVPRPHDAHPGRSPTLLRLARTRRTA